MSSPRILELLFYVLVGMLCLALLRVEIRSYFGDRRDPALRQRARQRLLRRGLGGSFLVLALILLKHPNPQGLSALQQAFRLLICLILCIGAIAITIWDFRVIRQEMKGEAKRFVEDSAQDLRRFLDKAAVTKRRRRSP